MVTHDSDHLIAMLSMYDMPRFIQPEHSHIWGEMEVIGPDLLFDEGLERDLASDIPVRFNEQGEGIASSLALAGLTLILLKICRKI